MEAFSNHAFKMIERTIGFKFGFKDLFTYNDMPIESVEHEGPNISFMESH